MMEKVRSMKLWQVGGYFNLTANCQQPASAWCCAIRNGSAISLRTFLNVSLNFDVAQSSKQKLESSNEVQRVTQRVKFRAFKWASWEMMNYTNCLLLPFYSLVVFLLKDLWLKSPFKYQELGTLTHFILTIFTLFSASLSLLLKEVLLLPIPVGSLRTFLRIKRKSMHFR